MIRLLRWIDSWPAAVKTAWTIVFLLLAITSLFRTI